VLLVINSEFRIQNSETALRQKVLANLLPWLFLAENATAAVPNEVSEL
jgi:hypothetical protein